MAVDKYHIRDPEELHECPYDKTHMVSAKRMPYHLMKCRANHPGGEYTFCPFNAKHQVRIMEKRWHIANCEDRCRIEPDLVHSTKIRTGDANLKGFTEVPPYHEVILPETGEDWDSECTSSQRYTRQAEPPAAAVIPSQDNHMEKYFLKKKKKVPQDVGKNPILALSMGVGRGSIINRSDQHQ